MEVSNKKQSKKLDYSAFDQLDGSHPLQKEVPESCVNYQVRSRQGGKLAYFNFDLAKQMGLIDQDHPNHMNSQLEKKILETFALIIINEYDHLKNTNIADHERRPGNYMATRYLQLQHEDKSGRTSGDGRTIWNGQLQYKGKRWDVSSGGAGATCLSPATSKYKKFFKSGDPTISYGCGYAEVEEGLASAFFSEVFFKNDIKTERILAIIRYEENYSINIRAHENLLRPSHFFNYLKQGKLESLKSMVDFYIRRMKSVKEWSKCPKDDSKYDFFLQIINDTFAKTAAVFESEYIFCWLDWDGDNILMDGGIIDYGSIRQFGLFHAEYRYDDDDRYSTTILEQKEKAKYIVQSFIQAIDFIKKGKKKGIGTFSKHSLLKDFETIFDLEKERLLLHKLGFNQKQVENLILHHHKTVKNFKKVFYYFERAKSRRGIIEVSDGITQDAIFCMRDLMRELPQLYLVRMKDISCEEFLEILKSNYADQYDLELTAYRRKMIQQYQSLFWKLIDYCAKDFSTNKEKLLLEMSMRSSVINKLERITGDSVTHIVDYVLNKETMLSVDDLYTLINNFSDAQRFDPKNIDLDKKEQSQNKNKSLMREIFQIVKEHREGI